MRSFFAILSRSPLGVLGASITTATALLILTLFGLELVGFHGSAYIGILTYLILPAVFLFGLALIPIGIVRQRRRERRHLPTGEFPILDFNRPRLQRAAAAVVFLTSINAVILSLATYKGVEVMESTEFCGTACHSVMQPEYTAYQASAHARVACVDCHIGPGAPWFVKSKLSGAWQVIAVTLDIYPTPIPTPIENLRPARETCEQCHWPTKFVGDRLKVIPHFEEDEASTHTQTVLLLKVGGIEGRDSHGIHWHVDPDHQVRYLSDPSRETIYTVELTDAEGEVKRFEGPEEPPEGAELTWRVMDCVDCHNRPAHTFQPAPRVLAGALSDGRLDPSLPYLARQGLELLESDYASHQEARQEIGARLASFYAAEYPEVAADRREEIDRAGATLADLWTSNVFPEMGVGWGTYPNHIGHEDTPGCWRCHDEEHETAEGEAISQDCDACHSLLAIEEEDPEILAELNP